MKKMKTKLLTLVMAFSMILTMAMSMNLEVQALNKNESQKLTVRGVENKTEVSVYKVIDLNIDDQGSLLSPTYKWNDTYTDWVNNNYSNYIDKDGNVTDTFIELSDTASKPFWESLASYVRTNNIDATKKQTATGSTVGFELINGEYLILANGGTTLSYVPTAYAILPKEFDFGLAVPEYGEVALKSTPITVEKEVEEDDDKTVGIGDVVTYKVTAKVPIYPENAKEITYIVGDKMGTGLTYNGDVKVYTNADCTDKVSEENYTDNPGNNDFSLTFDPEYVKNLKGASLYLKYSATVNKDAVSGEEGALKNDVTLTFNPDPYVNSGFTEIPDKEEVYTYNINFNKVDSDGQPLNGAEFELYEANGITKINLVELSDGTYRVAENNEESITTIKSNGNAFKLKGLDIGNYVLKETKSPNGYVLPADNKIEITLADIEPDGNLDQGTGAIATGVKLYGEPSFNVQNITFNVQNNTAGELKLPVTGGEGILMFTLAGAVIMGLAVVVFVVSNKRCNRK